MANCIAKYAYTRECQWMDHHLIPKDMLFILHADRERKKINSNSFDCRFYAGEVNDLYIQLSLMISLFNSLAHLLCVRVSYSKDPMH